MLVTDFRVDQERRGLLVGTIRKRSTDLRAFSRWLEPRELLEATTLDVEAFLDGRRLSARTRYGWLSNLHAFYEWAIRSGLTDSDPTARIPRPRLRQGLPRPISDADLAVALSYTPNLRMRAWLTLAAYAGLRCAEIAKLHREDILDAHGLLRIVGKGQRERLVPIHPAVTEALRAWGLPRTGPVFPNQVGCTIGPAEVSRQISEYLHGLGIDATAHQLRHWFGSKTYEHCQDIRAVQELLGHSSPTTTAIYAAFSQPVARAAVEGLHLGAPIVLQ